MRKISLLLVVILIVAFNTPLAFAQSTTIIVPDDFSTIQEAVNAANPGDTIYVRAGTYHEIVTINKNNLVLTGESKHTTIIDGGGGTDRTVLVDNADNVEITGFTIQNSKDGIYAYNASNVNVSGEIISSGNIAFGGAGYSDNSDLSTISSGGDNTPSESSSSSPDMVLVLGLAVAVIGLATASVVIITKSKKYQSIFSPFFKLGIIFKKTTNVCIKPRLNVSEARHRLAPNEGQKEKLKKEVIKNGKKNSKNKTLRIHYNIHNTISQ